MLLDPRFVDYTVIDFTRIGICDVIHRITNCFIRNK